ncbi:MAG: hypothetical protein R3302_07295 [Sulfurimonadaceae bacterium]|nr:hypothetical protein [Sulfurimonadaceae bacterium]
MKKVILGFVATMLLAFGASAKEFDLQTNMHYLNSHLASLQIAFITGDKKGAISAAKGLKKESDALLKDEAVMKKMLPKDQAHKVRIAQTSASMISDYVELMLEADRQNNREGMQSAYFGVQRACLRCHNLVRDW